MVLSLSCHPQASAPCPPEDTVAMQWHKRILRNFSLEIESAYNLPAMQKTRVLFLGQEDPLEKEMATHFTIFLPGKILWTEEPDGLPSMGSQESDTT